MKQYFIYLITIITLVSSCIQKREEPVPPENLIPKDVMMNILYDVQIIEARNQRRLIKKGQKLKDRTLGYYTALWNQYNVSEEEFKVSYNYYMETPDQMYQMWDEIFERMKIDQAKAQKEYDSLGIKEPKLKDQ